MPKGYWIVHLDVTQPEKFQAYMAANVEPFKKHGARFLARAGRYRSAEGGSRTRNTIIEFPTYEAALACWDSPEYQQAIRLRKEAAQIDLTIVEGYEGPQPA